MSVTKRLMVIGSYLTMKWCNTRDQLEVFIEFMLLSIRNYQIQKNMELGLRIFLKRHSKMNKKVKGNLCSFNYILIIFYDIQ